MRNKIISLNLVLILFLASCNPVPPVPLEYSGVINARGTDVADDNQIQTTLLTTRFNSLGEPPYTTIEGTGKTMIGALENADYKADVTLTGGQTSVEIFGMEAAKNGIQPYIESLIRNAGVSVNSYIVVGDPTANEVMMAEQYQFPLHVGRHLQLLIEKEIEENMIPDPQVHNFAYFMTEPGMDPTVPIVGNESGLPAITGLAVFRNDTYAGEVSYNEGFLLRLFRRQVHNTPFEISLPMEPFISGMKGAEDQSNNNEELSLQLTILRGNADTKLLEPETLHFQSNISLEINILEMSHLLRIEDQEIPQRLTHEIEKEFERQYEVLLEKLKEMNADPLGLGQIYRAQRPGGQLEDKEWREKHADVTVDFNVNVDVVEFGTLE